MEPQPDIVEEMIKTRKGVCVICAKDLFEQDSYVTDRSRNHYHHDCYKKTLDKSVAAV